MHRFDFSKMMIILERIADRFDLRKMMIAFFFIFLASIALRSMIVPDPAIPRLLVGEGVVALIIVALYMIMKPKKPRNPQHPIPSHEPSHLSWRIRSHRVTDEKLPHF
jgi:hypothetical protein